MVGIKLERFVFFRLLPLVHSRCATANRKRRIARLPRRAETPEALNESPCALIIRGFRELLDFYRRKLWVVCNEITIKLITRKGF